MRDGRNAVGCAVPNENTGSRTEGGTLAAVAAGVALFGGHDEDDEGTFEFGMEMRKVIYTGCEYTPRFPSDFSDGSSDLPSTSPACSFSPCCIVTTLGSMLSSMVITRDEGSDIDGPLRPRSLLTGVDSDAPAEGREGRRVVSIELDRDCAIVVDAGAVGEECSR